MQSLLAALAKTPVVYITRDIDRALGIDTDTPGYFIIANSSPFAKQMAGGRTNILLIEEAEQLDTWELLTHFSTQKFINDLRFTFNDLRILVFKPSKKIEQICAQNGWQLLNPPADLSAKIEEKITQLSFLPELKDIFPKYQVTKLSATNYRLPTPAVLQFNHSHTGEGTYRIKNEEQLNALKAKFPKREVRVTDFIDGPIFTNNNIVTRGETLIGNMSYQITGIRPFTDNPFATIGNDWSLAKKLLAPSQIEQYRDMAKEVGAVLKSKGWKGLFGIDVILNNKTGLLHLLEINARQPQSTTYESQSQEKIRITNHELRITVFEAHLAALLDLDLTNAKLISIDSGAQLIDRRSGVWHRSAQSIMTGHNRIDPAFLQTLAI